MSTAGIARKNWRAIRHSGNGKVVAVASRNRATAEDFIDECQSCEPFAKRPESLQGYDALLASDDVDAVYIPLPTGLRAEWILKAVRSGKHVLAEKPAGLNAKEVHTILDACFEQDVQYMDGVMFMHSSRMQQLRSVLDDGKSIGHKKRICCHFSFPSDPEFRRSNIRVMSQVEPYGCLGDLGWYCVRLILWVMQWKRPMMVVGRTLGELRGHGSPGTVPSEFSAELIFEDGVSAAFYCSFVTDHQQWAVISGEKGIIRISDFVLPYYGSEVGFELSNDHFLIDGCDFNMEQHSRLLAVNEYSNGRETAQEVNMFRTFGDYVLSKKHDLKWGQMTLATQIVIDALFQSAHHESKPIRPEY